MGNDVKALQTAADNKQAKRKQRKDAAERAAEYSLSDDGSSETEYILIKRKVNKGKKEETPKAEKPATAAPVAAATESKGQAKKKKPFLNAKVIAELKKAATTGSAEEAEEKPEKEGKKEGKENKDGGKKEGEKKEGEKKPVERAAAAHGAEEAKEGEAKEGAGRGAPGNRGRGGAGGRGGYQGGRGGFGAGRGTGGGYSGPRFDLTPPPLQENFQAPSMEDMLNSITAHSHPQHHSNNKPYKQGGGGGAGNKQGAGNKGFHPAAQGSVPNGKPAIVAAVVETPVEETVSA